MPRPHPFPLVPFPLVAVDVGNSRMKLGGFAKVPSSPRTEPDWTVALPLDAPLAAALDELPRPAGECFWAISSVNRPPTARLIEALAARRIDALKVLSRADLPLALDVAEPDRLGTDRIANALAARELRSAARPTIVVSVGSAITVDLVTADGAFAGGAILPSLDMSARALHEFTDLLPPVTVSESVPAVGRTTVGAMQAGLFWGAIGAIGEMVRRLDPGGAAEVFITGGGAAPLLGQLSLPGGRTPTFVPHLALVGIALAMRDAPPSRSP